MSYIEYIHSKLAEPPPRTVELSAVAKMMLRQLHVRVFILMGLVFAGVGGFAIYSTQIRFRGDYATLVGCTILGAALIGLPFYFIFRDLQFLRRGLLTEVRFIGPLPSKEKLVEIEYFVSGRRFVRKIVYEPTFYRSEPFNGSGIVQVIALPESGRILTFLQLSECTR